MRCSCAAMQPVAPAVCVAVDYLHVNPALQYPNALRLVSVRALVIQGCIIRPPLSTLTIVPLVASWSRGILSWAADRHYMTARVTNSKSLQLALWRSCVGDSAVAGTGSQPCWLVLAHSAGLSLKAPAVYGVQCLWARVHGPRGQWASKGSHIPVFQHCDFWHLCHRIDGLIVRGRAWLSPCCCCWSCVFAGVSGKQCWITEGAAAETCS
jgi:hypothetical protein